MRVLRPVVAELGCREDRSGVGEATESQGGRKACWAGAEDNGGEKVGWGEGQVGFGGWWHDFLIEVVGLFSLDLRLCCGGCWCWYWYSFSSLPRLCDHYYFIHIACICGSCSLFFVPSFVVLFAETMLG